MEKKKYWVLLPAVLLILATGIWAFRDAFLMRFLPQIPVGRAIQSAVVALNERYQESPVPILLRGYNENGLHTLHAELSEDGAAIGQLEIQSDLKEHQLLVQAAFPPGSKLPSLELYMDGDFAAITSEQLLRGGYYGITYESFSRDLSSIPLVSLLVSPQLRGEWEASVRDLQEAMNRSVFLPVIPDIQLAELKPALLGLWALRPKVQVVDLYEELDSREQPCWQVSYAVKGATAQFLWEKVLKAPYTGNEELNLSFYLVGNTLVQVKLNAVIGSAQSEYTLKLGQDLVLITSQTGPSGRTIQTISLTTGQDGETLRLDDKSFTYNWDSTTGALALMLPEKEPLSMVLTQTADGFRIQNLRLGQLVEKKNLFTDAAWDLTVTKGADLTRPPYKNMDQWSFEDLLILLNGVWSVFRES